MPNTLTTWISRLAFPLFLAAIIAPIVIFFPQISALFTEEHAIEAWLQSWGPWAPVAFVAAQVLQVVVFVIPGEVTQVAGGFLFGFWLGSAYSLLGILIGAAICYGIARWLGVRFVHSIAGDQGFARFETILKSPRLVGTFFLLFLIPGVPKDILCYLAGISPIRFLPFLLISTVARIPGILMSSVLGKALKLNDWTLFIAIAVTGAILFGIGWFFRQKILDWISRYAVGPTPKDN